jgi:ribonuclease G
MAKEICISSTPHETRLAILEDDQLAEIYYERENEYTLAGSIYNGRVTRVLPGMQSAFVDIGLERDAFLYVTDFLELEDPEETDEIEQAAASGGTQPLREVRGGRGEERPQPPAQKPEPRQETKPEPRQEQKQEPRREAKQEPRPERPSQDRPNQDRSGQRRMAVEAVPQVEEESFAAAVDAYPAPAPEDAQDESGDAGARRWRGRRRRRSGRGGATPGELQAESSLAPAGEEEEEENTATVVEAVVESKPAIAAEIHATAAPVYAPPAPRSEQVPFVLPGESLSKYGGAPAAEASKTEEAESAAPVRPASSYKPSTLIETPLEWDGSGLLPGESISRHRNRDAEPEAAAEVDAEPRGVFADAADFQPQAVAETEDFAEDLEETVEIAPEAVAEPFVEAAPEAAVEEDFVEEELVEEKIPERAEEEFEEEEFVEEEQTEAAAIHPAAEPVAETPAEITEEAPNAEPEPDAAASHYVDPVPPTGFRIFGLGGKKKKDDDKPAAHAEEDFIEEEAFAAPRPAAKSKPVIEEEIRRPAPRIPVKPEAKRILIDFDDSEETFGNDEDEDGEDQPVAPAFAQDSAPRQDRGDRGGRARRGRSGPPERMPERHSPPPMAAAASRRPPSRRSAQTTDLPIISDLLKPGQEILVQIAKEPIAQKGARITSHIALPGRFLVFMPTVSHIGVSRKIESEAERARLKRILVSERGEASGGFIVRTAAEDASEEDLRADLRFLLHLWNEIKTRSDSSKSPALIYHDLSLIERILRDQVSSNFSNIWVDSEAGYERIVRFLNHFSPSLTRRVKLYTKETPLFEHFGIQDEISKALRSKVWLKSGGSIVINQTEALVAIDINTGKYVGKSSRLEDTIVKTNLDAVPEIVRQIRLRDLGGIIVIDFIDMDDRKNRYKVMAALEEALKSDRAPTKVLQFNDFGLVAITRKRVKQSLERTLSVPCPTCQATGMVKSPTTVCNEIYTEMRKMKKHFEAEDILLRVNPETVKVLKANNAAWVTEFEELVGKNILIKSDATLHPEQFDIQG